MSGGGGTRSLVTGAGGYIGGALCAELRARGTDVVAVGHGLSDEERGALELRNLEEVRAIIEEVRPSVVYHLGGTSTSAEYARDPAGGNANVVQPSVNLFEAVASCAPGIRVVIVSPCEVYGRPSRLPIEEQAPLVPSDLYAAARAAVEYMAAGYRSRGVDVVIARVFWVSGPGRDPRRVLGQAAHRARRSEEVRSNELGLRRDIVDVRDVASGLILLGEEAPPASVVNLCSGVAHTVGDLVAQIVGDRSPVIAEPARSGDAPILLGSPARAEALGWTRRYTIEETLASLKESWGVG